MGINQLSDDGAVIGYQPNLQYKKETNTVAEVKSASATSNSQKTTHTSTLEGFANNLPSTSLKNIDYSIENIKMLVDQLASCFKNGNWNQYSQISSLLSAVESGNEEYIENFIDYHRNNITGSIIPELIGTMVTTEKRLEALRDTLKELYYGNSQLTTEEASEIDNAYLQQLRTYEANQEIEKINYLALSYDSEVNRSVNMYSFGVNKKMIDVADVVFIADDSASGLSKEYFVQKLFSEVNEELDFRKDQYNAQQSVEIMQKTLYNYYDKRQEIMDLYDLFSENQSSIFIGSKIQEYTAQLDDTVKNINRTFAGNQYYLAETVKLEQEKHFLKNIYATINYNSEK